MGEWSTGPNSAQEADFYSTVTAVTAWLDQAMPPAGSTLMGSISGIHHHLFVKVNILNMLCISKVMMEEYQELILQEGHQCNILQTFNV